MRLSIKYFTFSGMVDFYTIKAILIFGLVVQISSTLIKSLSSLNCFSLQNAPHYHLDRFLVWQ